MKQALALLIFMILLHFGTIFGAEYEYMDLLLAQGRFKELREEAERRLNTPESLDAKSRLGVMKYWIDGLMGTGSLREVLSAANEMIELPKPDSLRYYDVRAYIAMNDIFCQLNYMEPARQALDKADETLGVFRSDIESCRWRRLNESLHMAKSVQAQSEGDLSRALREWQKVPFGADSKVSHTVAWYGLGGSLYQDMGETAKAEELFRNALETVGFTPNKLPVLLRYMAIMIEKENFQGALNLCERYENGVEVCPNTRLRGMLLNAKADANRYLGLHEEASILYSQALDCLDSVVTENSQVATVLLAERINPEDYTALQRRVEIAQTEKQRVIIGALICLTVLLLGLCGALWLKVRESRRLRSTEERLSRSNREHDAERAELTEVLTARESEICRLSMAAEQSESTIITIRKEMTRKSATAEEHLQVVESVLRDSAAEANLQETFRERFDAANQQLYSRLSLFHPDLTKAEMNMAAYILLNMNSKEIARMSNRSVRTVDNIKYSLRKKLAVTEPVHVYLRRLMSEQ